MSTLQKVIGIIIGIFTIVGIFFGAFKYIDGNYAKAYQTEEQIKQTTKQIKMVENRLDYKITSDQVQSINQRMWQIEDRYERKQMPETVKEEYRKLQEDKKELQKKLDSLQD